MSTFWLKMERHQEHLEQQWTKSSKKSFEANSKG